MFTKLAKYLSPGLRKKEEGFTLIELLIVVAIIAILAAIAIPQFSSYRKRGYNAAAMSDLRNLRTSEEAMMADFQDYGATTITIGGVGGVMSSPISLAGGQTTTTTQSMALSPGVSATAISADNTAGTRRTDYLAKSAHSSGDNYYGADSDTTNLYRAGFTGTPNTGTYIPTTSTSGADNIQGNANWIAIQ